MIDRAEIVRLASELNLRPEVVEKDYVLGWILAGIAQDAELGRAWIFKGGTCLKKCFFETYRFSEDLDFTITERAHLESEFLFGRFRNLSAWLYNKTGIEIPADRLRFDVYDTARGSRAGEGRLYYRGPLARGGDLPRIKLDLTADEALVSEPVRRPVTHPYTDAPDEGIEALCYSYEEVFGEKVRALGERTRPRDLYDVVNLFRHGEFQAAATTIRDIVQKKCAFKSIPFPTLAALESAKEELIGEWGNMLGHQLPALPPVESFLAVLPEFFEWLAGVPAPVALAPHPLAGRSEVVRGPFGAIATGRHVSFIETIRFAAANRLCVELDYRDEAGKRSTRTIEPYSLRRSQADDVSLMAVRVDSGEPRAYRLDRILGARATQTGYIARYPVELTPTGPLAIPDTSRGPRSYSPSPRITRPARQRILQGGPTYVFQCPVCGKKFSHRSYDATLRPHKNKDGWDCYGRVGHHVT